LDSLDLQLVIADLTSEAQKEPRVISGGIRSIEIILHLLQFVLQLQEVVRRD
jgi:hypothetical protein